MISVNDFRTGITIKVEGELYQVVEFLHVKPGKGSAFVRSKLKNLQTGYLIEKTFRGGEKVERAHIDRRKMQFLYHQEELYVFMDSETFEQVEVGAGLVGEATRWLKDGMEVEVSFHEGRVLGVEVPPHVELTVVKTEPGFKGDTATGATKPAVLETGAEVQVPLFVEEGDVLQVDTRTGEYLRRV